MTEREASEKISLNSRAKEENKPEEVKPWRERLSDILKSNVIQYGIIIFVVLDSVIVILELLIDMEIIKIPENDHTPSNTSYHEFGEDIYNLTTVTAALVNHNGAKLAHPPVHNDVYHGESHDDETTTSLHNNSSSDRGHIGSGHMEHAHHTNKETAEHILHYISLTILSIFVVEVFIKIVAEGIHLLKHKAEVFDAIVVIVSFSLDIAFSFVTVTKAAQDAAGLMVLLRLWRVTRIINGVIMSVKMDADKKIQEQKAARAKAEQEVELLKEQVDDLQKEVQTLRDKLQHFKIEDEGTSSSNQTMENRVFESNL